MLGNIYLGDMEGIDEVQKAIDNRIDVSAFTKEMENMDFDFSHLGLYEK